jgi:hypothetical protein
MTIASSSTTTTSRSFSNPTMNDRNDDSSNSSSNNNDNSRQINGKNLSLNAPSTPSSLNVVTNNIDSARSNGSQNLRTITTVVYNVTTTTKKLVDKSAETTKTMVVTTKKHTHKLVKQSKSTIETNRWLLPLKWCLHFPRHWPRTYAIVWVIVLLWILIGFSMAFGIQLSQAEAPTEIDGNDAVLAARAHIDYFETSSSELLNVTQACLVYFIDKNDLTNDDDDDFVQVNRTGLESWLQGCLEDLYLPYLEAYQQVAENNSATASQSLRFNWNRCWELKDDAQFEFYPTWEMVYAARPHAQADYYTREWTTMQQELYQAYLPSNATEGEQYEAFLRSIEDATGADACEENMAATAWFFFTIMTTMGFGNQAPVTSQGRIMVVSAGLFSLILFGVVLGWCGYVTLAIFDDAVGRLGKNAKRVLGNPIVGIILWGTIWILYALSLAKDFDLWWEVRLPEYAAQIDQADVLWFAFISTATIGLGDYYLQPEVIFASDALKYSLLFMVGFVFLSTFFGKIVEFLQCFLPSKHNSLENRLAKTRVLACWPVGWMPWEKVPQWGDDDETAAAAAAAAASGDNADDQALLYRIERVKELKPDPPLEEDGTQPHRGLVSALRGSPIHSMNVELLRQEEALLREWLAVVQHQRERALLKRAGHQVDEMTPNGASDDNSDANEDGDGGGGSNSDRWGGELSEEASECKLETFSLPPQNLDDQSNHIQMEEEETKKDIEDFSSDKLLL